MNNQNQIDSVIRITANEAKSAHVDDLLQRQANMRGNAGITRDKRGTWYYRNWFILGLAGTAAAFLCWLITDPYFSDYMYVQGTITTSTMATTPPVIDATRKRPIYFGTITIAGDEIKIGPFTGNLNHKPFHPGAVDQGKTVGVYCHPIEDDNKLVWLARFIDTDPAPRKGSTLGLIQLAQRSHATGMIIFALMAALIGLFVGAVDGLVCRMYARAAISGIIGLGVGFLGGFILTLIATLVYQPINEIAQQHIQDGSGGIGGMTIFGFTIQMMGRTLAWGLAGVAMGLGQGIALRSKRLFLFGLIGGVVGGVLGGMLFDPINMLIIGSDAPSASLSRLIGFLVIGASVGSMIGIVELLARDAWLRMEQGPLAGKEFLVFKDVMKIGASPRSDIYLFNDPSVQNEHAILRVVGENIEIESARTAQRVLLNDRPIARSRLRNGDRITLGRTVFVYMKRGG